MKGNKWIDISQPLTYMIGHWPGDIPFSYEITFSKQQTGSVNIGQVTTSLHTGTHVDAPFHFKNDGAGVDQLDINIFIGPARVIDVSTFAEINRHVLSKFDLTGAERLLLQTSVPNNPAVFPEKIPALSADTGPFLRENGIFLIGVDVPSVDQLDSKEMRAHHSLYENGIHILENVMLDHVEPGDYELIALPLKMEGADGSPVRAAIRSLDYNRREF